MLSSWPDLVDLPSPATQLHMPTSTQLYPPRLRRNVVARPHLLSLLMNDHERRVTLVTGPAGYGKSTLVAQWLSQEPSPSAWASIEPGDNDVESFFSLITAALRTIDPDLPLVYDRVRLTRPASESEDMIGRLLGGLSLATRPFVLVLDNYHLIETPEIHWIMEVLLQHLPRAMSVVIVSRTEPPLRLARLRANGDLLHLDGPDLLFSEREALQLLQNMPDLAVTASDVAAINERTEGWVAGLQLAAAALRRRSRKRVPHVVEDFAGQAAFGHQYLWEEVLQREPEDVRRFLLETSILDRFCAELCTAVTGIDQCDAMIRRCQQHNLFIVPLDDSGTWFRFHNLFAQVLRERLFQTVTDTELDRLHLRSSQWLEDHGQIDDCIRHAVAGHVWERAVPLLERHCAHLFECDDIAALRFWLEGLPAGVLERSHQLAFWLAWAHGRAGHWAEATPFLRVAEAGWTADGEGLARRGSILLWHACRAVYTLDSRRAIEYADQALELLSPEQSTERIMALMCRAIAHIHHGEPPLADASLADVRKLVDMVRQPRLRSFEMAYSARVLALQGKLREAAALSRQIIRSGGAQPTEFWVQAALHQLGLIYLEWNMLDDASECLNRAEDLAHMTRSVHWRSRISVGLARVAFARGEVEEAHDEIERAIGAAMDVDTLQEVRNARAWQARFWLAAGHIALARRWADSCDLDPYLPPEYERQVESLTHARLLLHEGRPELALRIIEPVLGHAEAAMRCGDLVEIQALIAMAHAAHGDANEAFHALHRSLVPGVEGYTRAFVDEGDNIVPLLRHAAARGVDRENAQRLLSAIEGTALVDQHHHRSPLNELSEREFEVLRLVAVGLPNRDIGQRLFISEKTVKKHLSNILGKLGATNRTQAVDAARRLRVLQ